MKMRTLALLLLLSGGMQAQSDYFFPTDTRFDAAVPSPEEFLGYPIGEWHTRHDRLVAYFEHLAEVSERAQFQIIGYTNERRPQVVLTISTPENLARLDDIRREHLALANPTAPLPELEDMPVVVLLGYGVHGNEASSAEAAMLTAYWLLASDRARELLPRAVIHIDPVYNPDGRDRHTGWVNMHKGNPPVADPLDREHNEVWPRGRTNHYWFDLNRDWLPLTQVESQNRVAFYHRWLPNVATDYHEMGSSATYFFEPTKPIGSENPLVPRRNYEELNNLFADYFRRALDAIGSLYYTRESFDNSYPGYGSTYPDLQGGLGLLFEQASSRGHLQRQGGRTFDFAFTIRNQVRTGLATVQAAVENRLRLLEYQRWFFEEALRRAGALPFAGWRFDLPHDGGRRRAFLQLLLRHHIEVRPLGPPDRATGFVVPARQPQYLLAASIFEPRTNADIPDSVFYDASGWAVALAFNIRPERLKTLPEAGPPLTLEDLSAPRIEVPPAAYGYLFDWRDSRCARLLHRLLDAGVRVRTAFKPLKVQTHLGERSFGRGTLLVALGEQEQTPIELHALVLEAAREAGVPAFAVDSGRSLEGIDLGSRNFPPVEAPKALLVVGEGVSGYEAGEVWHLLDTRAGMPITKVDVKDWARVPLHEYNTLVLVSGSYRFSKKEQEKIKDWLAAGNTLITLRQGTRWALEADLVPDTLAPAPKPERFGRRDFAEARDLLGSRRIGGVVFEADVDPTHPLGFGYDDRRLFIYRNHDIVVAPSKNPFSTVVRYTGQAQVDGYVHPESLERLKGSASLLVSKVGRGRAILFVDNPNFRGFWQGTNRLFLNALFFGGLVVVPS